MADGIYDINNASDALKSLAKEATPTAERFAWAFSQMIGGAEALNKTFGQGRQRITELMVAVADATPAVDRLGGNLKDAVETIQDISKATSRNITASSDEVSKLFSASKLLERNVDTIVSGFQDVGVQFSQIGGQIEQSLQYVQSIGGNAGQIMGRVLDDMTALNKYNFENGVVGLTKMAAQASMLKFDMRQTFELADKAMSPDGAIELASAFQRLGVAAGDLTDPFQLMYKSLNDPEGLQDSLVEMTKQYTYFDEKTKSFKISPAGILQLKELQTQTGLNAQEMSKLALNAADLDKKLSQLKPSIKFESEEDKMYLANIAKMGVGGEYEVKVSDTETKRLQDVTQQEFDKLIKSQKEGPKSLEDLQRSQLDAFTVVRGDVRSIRDKILFGVTSADTVRTEGEGVNRLLRQLTEKTEREFDQKYFREKAQGGIDTVKDIVSAMSKGEDMTPALQKAFDSAFKTMVEAGEKADEGTKSVISKLIQDIKPNTWVEKNAIDILKGIQKEEDGKEKTQGTKQKGTGVSMGTHSMSESYKAGSASIVNRVDVTNELTKEGNNKLEHIAKNIAPSKTDVAISDNVANIFKASSVGLSDKVGITNDLTKISNDKLDGVEKVLNDINKGNLMTGSKESINKNISVDYGKELSVYSDNIIRALKEFTKTTNQPETKKELTNISTNIKSNEELNANADGITRVLNQMKEGKNTKDADMGAATNQNIKTNNETTASTGNILKGFNQTKEVMPNSTDGFDIFNTSTASLIDMMTTTNDLTKNVINKLDTLTNQFSQTTKLETVSLTRNNVYDAVSKTQPSDDTVEKKVNHKHSFDGTITWKIDAPTELDTKRFYAMIDKQEFKDMFAKIVIDKFKETERTSMSEDA